MDIFNPQTLSTLYPNVERIVVSYDISSGGMGVISTSKKVVITPKDRIMENIPCPNRTCGCAIPMTGRIDHCIKNGLTRYEFEEMCQGKEDRLNPHSGMCMTTFKVCIDVCYHESSAKR